MNKIFLLLTFFISHSSLAFCQANQLKPFIIEGKVNVDTGKIELSLIADSALYLKSSQKFATQIINGTFVLTGEIPNPMGYYLSIKSKYRSSAIVIEPGRQTIVCNIDSSNKLPKINNEVMKDFERYTSEMVDFRERSNAFELEYAALRKEHPNGIPEDLSLASEIKRQSLYDEGDRNLEKFVLENPGSYWALWRLINLSVFGYEKIFDQILPHFTDSIRSSYSGKEFTKVLKKSGVLSVGNRFPQMDLTNINGSKSKGLIFGKNKYTLVDFWYTNCSPCLAKFPSYINIYEKYHAKGFEIVCIATDAAKFGKDLPKVIKTHKVNWVHFWDLNGNGASALSVHAFPTSFLLDQNGNILQKNIGSAELNEFLKVNL
jgi:thiol-disulfide isomerase/thioredoxin